MNGMDILKQIIAEEGNCCWSKPSICISCPLSKLKVKQDGSFMSCIESLGVQDLTEAKADARYKDVATRILLDETVDQILGDINGS
jgi:hypothetical protein